MTRCAQPVVWMVLLGTGSPALAFSGGEAPASSRAAPDPGARGDEVVAALIPQPQEVALAGTDFVVRADTRLVLSPRAGEGERSAAAAFNDFLAENGLALLEVIEAGAGTETSAGHIRIGGRVEGPVAGRLVADPLFREQGYRLCVTGTGVVLQAEAAAGLFYGVQTLKQLARFAAGRATVRGVRITDWPCYALRGFQFDAGRSPHTIPAMKRIVRIAGTFKLNFVIFREGDDELCSVRYKTNRLGSRNPTALAIDDVAAFVRYASRYHVQVVPEIESLGHSSAKGFDYPDLIDDFGPKTKYPGIGIHHRKRRLILSKPEAYELLRSIYSEWVPILNTPYMHLGCDEAGGGSPEHLAKLHALLKDLGDRHGRAVRPIVWADAAPTPPEMKGRYVRCLWEYGDGLPIGLDNPHLTRQGIQSLVSPGCVEPVIMAGGSGSLHTALSKLSYDRAFANLHTWSRFGRDRSNFIGLLSVQWGGNQQDLWVPDYVVAGEYGWSPDWPAYDFETLMVRVRRATACLRDYTHPGPEEVNRPAWDGIWLDDQGRWQQDIMGKALPMEPEPPKPLR